MLAMLRPSVPFQVLLLVTVLAAAPAPDLLADSTGRTYDDGQLETRWFGGDQRFVDAKSIDYLWVKDGFEIDGKTFHFQPWEEPQFLGEDAEDRDAEDRRLARQINATVHEIFAEILGETWAGKAETSLDGGDVRVSGRIVSCSTGNRSAKLLVGFGAGAGHITFDLKFTDAKSGELLAAIHHRTVSGTAWSTTNSKFAKWIKKLGKNVADDGFATLYAKGDVEDD